MTMITEDRDDDDVNKVSAGLPERRDETREDETRLDQTRPDQARVEQSRLDQTIPNYNLDVEWEGSKNKKSVEGDTAIQNKIRGRSNLKMKLSFHKVYNKNIHKTRWQAGGFF